MTALAWLAYAAVMAVIGFHLSRRHTLQHQAEQQCGALGHQWKATGADQVQFECLRCGRAF